MNREEALQLTDTALEQLTQALAQGKSDTLKTYLTTLARFHNYSFGNVLMIAVQKPDATHVAGFQTWRKLGRFVKKGEKGIAILAPLVYRKKGDDDAEGNTDRRDAEPVATVEADSGDATQPKATLRGFKIVHVFDVTQTDGESLPEFATISGTPGEHLARIREMIQSQGITLDYEPISGGALGMSEGGRIRICPDLPPAEEFSVLVHELAHEMLHKGDRRAETTKTIRETEAEAVAFIVSHAIGLDCSTRSSDYIQLYSGGADTLVESLEHIQKTAAHIIHTLQAAA